MKKFTKNVVFASVLVTLTLLSLISINAQTNQKSFVDGTLYLKFKDNASLSVSNFQGEVNPNEVYFLDGLVNKYQIKSVEFPFISAKSDLLQRTLKIKFENIEETSLLINDLKKVAELEYVEQAPIYKTAAVENPNDEYFNKTVVGLSGVNNLGTSNSSWHLNKIKAQEAWGINAGDASVVVAVLDNAIWTSHPDLINKIVSEIDMSDLGNIQNDANPPASGNPYAWSHGTHVAGIIAGESDNTIGVASVGNQVKIMAIKLASNSGNGSDILNLPEAIIYAADNGANVINISDYTSTWSQTLLNACNYAYNKGCVIVAAAGNEASTAKYYPAAFESVISVGSTNFDDNISDFSNRGQYVDIYAPGGYSTLGYSGMIRYSILSTTYNTCGELPEVVAGTSGGAASYSIDGITPISGNYDLMYGTSAASAIVSGVCALIVSENQNLPTSQIKQILLNSADVVDDGIRVNAFNAVQEAEDTVLTWAMPYADFEASETAVNLNETVSFTNLSTGNYDFIEWTFEGGVPSRSTEQNPTILYNIRGNFDVSLKLTLMDTVPQYIYDTLVVIDSVWYRDSLYHFNELGKPIVDLYFNHGPDNCDGIRDSIYLTHSAYPSVPEGQSYWVFLPCYHYDTLTKIDTVFNIKKVSKEIKRKLILVGNQIENMNDLAISALREQLLNLGDGYSVIKIVPTNKDTVWALSYDGTNYTLSRTFDYGFNWTNISLSTINLDTVFDFSATSADNIWVLASTNGGATKGVFFSNDGGTTWSHQSTAFNSFTGNLRKLRMANDTMGICVGEEDNGEKMIIYKTTDGGNVWGAVADTCFTRRTGEYASTNIFAIDNILAFGTSRGRIIKTENLGATWNADTVRNRLDSTYCIKSLTYASVKRQTSTIYQGLILAENNIGTKLVKTTNGTDWINVAVNNANGLIKDASITPMDVTTLPSNNNNATEFVIIVEDTLPTHPYNNKSMYSKDGGTTWEMVDNNINYTTIALYDYHRGWFGGVTSDFSGGIYKWFDVPEISFNSVEIFEGDTVGIIDADFFKKPKQHLYITASDPDGRQTIITDKKINNFFLFNYPYENRYDIGEIKGVSLYITGREREVYSYTAEANNGVRYNSHRDTAIIVNSTKHKFVFITSEGDTIFSKLVDTTIYTNQLFVFNIITKDKDLDAMHSTSGLGDVFSFSASLPYISGSMSWLYFEDNKDTTIYYKTATISGVSEHPRNNDIVEIFVSDGTFKDTLTIRITVNSIDVNINLLDNIDIYPNPTSNIIYIRNADGLKYEMFDIAGRVIKSGYIKTATENINIENIPNGSYFIRFVDTDKTITKKLIKL